jgi:hypothetical protein
MQIDLNFVKAVGNDLWPFLIAELRLGNPDAIATYFPVSESHK